MDEEIKTSIVIDRNLWKRLKLKVSSKSLKGLSEAVEEALKEELSELIVVEALEKEIPSERAPLDIIPVKPRIKTAAEEIVRELRGSRDDSIS